MRASARGLADAGSRVGHLRRGPDDGAQARRLQDPRHRGEQEGACEPERAGLIAQEYIELIVNWRIVKRVEEQFQAFLSGFNELIPQGALRLDAVARLTFAELINVFDERELELLIGGMSDVDCDDWYKHTDYRGYTQTDDVVQCASRRSVASLTPQGSGRSCAPGRRTRSRDCCSACDAIAPELTRPDSRPALPASPSTASSASPPLCERP